MMMLFLEVIARKDCKGYEHAGQGGKVKRGRAVEDQQGDDSNRSC